MWSPGQHPRTSNQGLASPGRKNEASAEVAQWKRQRFQKSYSVGSNPALGTMVKKKKPKSDFWKGVERLVRKHKERCKTDPVFRAEHERVVKQRECFRTHKKWLEDRDIHGHLGRYCADCYVWRVEYAVFEYQRNSFLTCKQIKAKRDK